MTQLEIQKWLHQELVASGTDEEDYNTYETLFADESPSIEWALRDVFDTELLKVDDIDYGDGEINTSYYFKVKDKIVEITTYRCGQYCMLSQIKIVELSELITICQNQIDYYQSTINNLTKIINDIS